MRVLILSCDTGGGHNACARAIQEAFLECGCHCDVADSVQFVSEKLSKFMSWGHTTMYRHIPGLFRFGYGFAEKHPAMLDDDAAVYKLLTGGTEQLHAYIQEGKYDSVICSHVFSGLLLRQTLKEDSPVCEQETSCTLAGRTTDAGICCCKDRPVLPIGGRPCMAADRVACGGCDAVRADGIF